MISEGLEPLLICKNFVELRGFEPLTPSMPWRCATSCATAPHNGGTATLTPRSRMYRSAPAPNAGLVMDAITAVTPVIEVDAVFAVAAAPRLSHIGSLQPGSPNGSHVEPVKIEHGSDLQLLGGAEGI